MPNRYNKHRLHNRQGLPQLTEIGKKIQGRVVLVGAGPGDLGLITVRGMQWLEKAEVVIYDALVNPHLLAAAPQGAECIDVGKRAKAHKLSQDQINALMTDKARQGLLVVRLKGGDPFLFGRGAEEAAYLTQHGINVEVVPGLTAGAAAPAAAGIPVTHRGIASTVTFVTGHEDPSKETSSVDYAALATLIAAGGTVCFYMGISRLAAITENLIAAGTLPGVPGAVVQWGTLPIQRSVRSTLATLAADAEAAGVWAPSIIVVGQVAGIDAPGLDGFVKRPLFGQTIINTRPVAQAKALREQLTDLGAAVLDAPAIAIEALQDTAQFDAALRAVASYDWLVFTSAAGVEAAAQRLAAIGLDARALAGVKVAAVGRATAEALHHYLSVNADLIPEKYVAEALAEALKHQGKRFLLLRADLAREALATLLRDGGAHVDDVIAYHTVMPEAWPITTLDALRDGRVDWITFTSSSTVRNTVALLGDEVSLLNNVKIASIGPITSDTVRACGLAVDAQAEPSDIDGLIAAMVQATA